MPESSRGDGREKEREKRQREAGQRQKEEVENEEVVIISLPVFDQWSMGNRGSAESWSTAPEERSSTFLLALSPLLQNHLQSFRPEQL